jgi:hypothetical protein
LFWVNTDLWRWCFLQGLRFFFLNRSAGRNNPRPGSEWCDADLSTNTLHRLTTYILLPFKSLHTTRCTTQHLTVQFNWSESDPVWRWSRKLKLKNYIFKYINIFFCSFYPIIIPLARNAALVLYLKQTNKRKKIFIMRQTDNNLASKKKKKKWSHFLAVFKKAVWRVD